MESESEHDQRRDIERKKVEDLYTRFQMLASKTITTSERCDKHFVLLEDFKKQLQDIESKLKDYPGFQKHVQNELKQMQSSIKSNEKNFKDFSRKSTSTIDEAIQKLNSLQKEIHSNNIGKVNSALEQLKEEYKINMKSVNQRISSLEDSKKNLLEVEKRILDTSGIDTLHEQLELRENRMINFLRTEMESFRTDLDRREKKMMESFRTDLDSREKKMMESFRTDLDSREKKMMESFRTDLDSREKNMVESFRTDLDSREKNMVESFRTDLDSREKNMVDYLRTEINRLEMSTGMAIQTLDDTLKNILSSLPSNID